jgi:DNA-binding IclR family transcriptional regulator
MPRPSNPTARVVGILDFLAARPERSYGLSELARSLGINKATCLTVLAGLVSSGYLLQDPEAKTYSLGPSSLALGNAALARFPAVAPARAVMQDLADEFGVVCTVMVRANNNLVVLAEAGTPGPLRVTLSRVGLRTPFIPPLGATFIAWATPVEFEQWMHRAQPPLDEAERTELRRVVAVIRARGFQATQLTAGETVIQEFERSGGIDPERTLSQVVTAMARRIRHQPNPYAVVQIEPTERYVVGIVAAPVFGEDGRPLLSLVLEGFRWRVDGSQLRRIGERLVAAARGLSVDVGGRPPDFQPLGIAATTPTMPTTPATAAERPGR